MKYFFEFTVSALPPPKPLTILMVDHLGCFHNFFSLFSISLHFLFYLEGVLQVCLPILTSHFSFIFLTFKISFFPFQTLHLLKMKVFSYRFWVFSNENADDCF